MTRIALRAALLSLALALCFPQLARPDTLASQTRHQDKSAAKTMKAYQKQQKRQARKRKKQQRKSQKQLQKLRKTNH